MRVLLLGICLALGLTALSVARPLSPVGGHDLVYTAHADVDGDGQSDLVTLQRHPAAVGHIEVRLATGRSLAIRMRSDAPFVPGLTTSGNVNGVRGDELFVDMQHFPTSEVIGVFTYAGGRLRLARKLLAYSSDFPLRYGITCGSAGSKHRVTQYQFQLHVNGGHWRWTRKVTNYAWKGAALRVIARHHVRAIAGHPPPRQVGVHCGQVPAK